MEIVANISSQIEAEQQEEYFHPEHRIGEDPAVPGLWAQRRLWPFPEDQAGWLHRFPPGCTCLLLSILLPFPSLPSPRFPAGLCCEFASFIHSLNSPASPQNPQQLLELIY